MQSLSDIIAIADSHMKELLAVGCDIISHIEVLREHQERYRIIDLFAMCTLDEESKTEVLRERNRAAYTFLVVAVV